MRTTRTLDSFLAPCDTNVMIEDLEAAHKHCSGHRDEIAASTACGCFYCVSIFQPNEIEDWVNNGGSALCPRCGIDSVIGDASGFPVTIGFMASMRRRWFEKSVKIRLDR